MIYNLLTTEIQIASRDYSDKKTVSLVDKSMNTQI